MSLSTPVSQVSDLTIRDLLIELDNVSPIADLMLHDPLVGKSAWVRRSLDPGDCLMPNTVACLAQNVKTWGQVLHAQNVKTWQNVGSSLA